MGGYASGCRGAGAGVWHGMQPYSIERGHGDVPILHSPPDPNGLVSMQLGFRFTLCWKNSNWLQTLAVQGRHQQQKTLDSSVNAYLLSFDLKKACVQGQYGLLRIQKMKDTRHTHVALASPLWGHVAVAVSARSPICGHADLVRRESSRRW